jgi:uncharacterized protein (TIGR00730 family)
MQFTEEQKNIVSSWTKELYNGFNIENQIDHNRPIVTIYGSARLAEDTTIYKDISDLSILLEARRYNRVTGGGPGVMKAGLAEKLQIDNDTIAYGININKESHRAISDLSNTFDEFAVRKHFLRDSDAFIACPGGFGTMDEINEVITLMQTKKMPVKPIVLFKSEYWNGFITWVKEQMLDKGYISASDLDMLKIIDEPSEVVNYLDKHIIK